MGHTYMMRSWPTSSQETFDFRGFGSGAPHRGAQTAQALGCAPGGAAALEIAGGCAIFAGVDSPLTQAVGLGLNAR